MNWSAQHEEVTSEDFTLRSKGSWSTGSWGSWWELEWQDKSKGCSILRKKGTWFASGINSTPLESVGDTELLRITNYSSGQGGILKSDLDFDMSPQVKSQQLKFILCQVRSSELTAGIYNWFLTETENSHISLSYRTVKAICKFMSLYALLCMQIWMNAVSLGDLQWSLIFDSNYMCKVTHFLILYDGYAINKFTDTSLYIIMHADLCAHTYTWVISNGQSVRYSSMKWQCQVSVYFQWFMQCRPLTGLHGPRWYSSIVPIMVLLSEYKGMRE